MTRYEIENYKKGCNTCKSMHMFISPKKHKGQPTQNPPLSDMQRLKELLEEREEHQHLIEPYESF